MAETVPAQCGLCRKQFRLRADQLNREVRCPHCKTVVRITPRTDAALEAAQALRDTAPKKPPPVGRRPPPPMARGVQSQSVAIVMFVLVGVGLIGGGIGVWAVFLRGDRSLAPPTGSLTASGRHLVSDPQTAAGSAKAGTPDTGAAAGRSPAEAGPIVVTVERLLGGFKDGTLTYAVGRVRNNTNETIRALKVSVPIADASDKQLGEATVVILNLAPKTTAPVVAEWLHDENTRANRWWQGGYTVDPPGVPVDLPALVADDPWAQRDANAVSPTGQVKIRVTNQGMVAVRNVDVRAILVSSDGKIVGIARGIVEKEVKPKGSADISVPWDRCAGTLVHSAEVWAQPAF